MKRLSTFFAALFAAIIYASPAAHAQDTFPDRPISMMVSYGAGGATDFQARIVTMVAGNEDYLGQPIVIVNRPGAGGRVGWNWFATDADADGYNLAVYNIPHFIAQSIQGGVKYSTDSFEPIANWGSDPAVFVVGADSPFNSMADVITFMKDNPGRLTVSGAGLFVGHHIAALQIERATGTSMQYVPNPQGGTAALQAVVSGDVMAGINNLSDAFRAAQAGTIKVLAVADLQRDKDFLPDVPTLMEQGIDVDDSSVNFRGIMARKGTPPAVIEFLAARIPAMFADPQVSERMEQSGSTIRIMDREAVKKMWADRQAYLADLLKGL
jgi:tripartite-type tricarboxylate transporter receptor subunit TctC